MASKDFNYQVALKEGLKSLEQGRLRQAEQSFKYLVDKFPGAEGGYRGLAKVHFEQEDRASALRVLRDGAAALTKSGERPQAIGLLREAITLEPRDLATHRRRAAALALAGDTDAAIGEYARLIRDLRDAGDAERASLETAYALGQLRHIPGSAMLKEIANGEAPPPTETTEESEPEPPARATETTTLRPNLWQPIRGRPRRSRRRTAPSIRGHRDPPPRSRRPQRRLPPPRRPLPRQSHRRPRPRRQPCGPSPPPNGPRKRRPTCGRRRARPRLPPRRRPRPPRRRKPMTSKSRPPPPAISRREIRVPRSSPSRPRDAI